MATRPIIFGIVILVATALYMWEAIGEYINLQLSGQNPDEKDFWFALFIGSIGIGFGIFVIILGVKMCSSS